LTTGPLELVTMGKDVLMLRMTIVKLDLRETR